jgi:hypothetical protein
MAEPKPSQINVDDACIGGGHESVDIDICCNDDPAGLQDLANRVPIVESGDQQDQARHIRQIRHPGGEGTLEASAQRHDTRHRFVGLGPVDHDWQLEQRKRISSRLAQHPASRRTGKTRHRPVEQGVGSLVVEPSESELLQPRVAERRTVTVTNRRQHDDWIRGDAPSDKGEHLCCWGVKPLSVIDNQKDGGGSSGLRDEVKYRHRDSEVLRHILVGQAERGVERGALNQRQIRGPAAHRPQELMQAGKGQLCLGLHPDSREHQHASRPRTAYGLGQQTRLADSRLTSKHERAATQQDFVQDRFEKALLTIATQHHWGLVGRRPEHRPIILHRCGRGWRSSNPPPNSSPPRPQFAIYSLVFGGICIAVFA